VRSERVRRPLPLSALAVQSLSVGLSACFVDVYAHTFTPFWRGLLPDQWAQLPLVLAGYLGLCAALSLGLHALLARALRWLRPYANVVACLLVLAVQLLVAQDPVALWPAVLLALCSAIATPLAPALFPLRPAVLRHRAIGKQHASGYQRRSTQQQPLMHDPVLHSHPQGHLFYFKARASRPFVI